MPFGSLQIALGEGQIPHAEANAGPQLGVAIFNQHRCAVVTGRRPIVLTTQSKQVALGELAEVVTGDAGRALAWLDVHGLPEGVERLALQTLGEHPLREAHALLQRLLSSEGPLPLDEQRDLLQRLQLAYRLGWRPLPRPILDNLGAVLEHALSRRQRLPGPCCLALATLGTPQERERVLVAVARRLEETKTPSGQLPLQSLLTMILAASPGTTPTADQLLSPLPLSARAELRAARIAALLQLGRARKALIEAQLALQRHPGHAGIEALRKRAVAALNGG